MAVALTLIEFDQYIFSILNGEWTNSFFDTVLPYWRNKYVWLPVYLFIIAYFILNYSKKGYYFILALLLTVGTADLMSSHVIKKSVQRLRPCNEPTLLDERVLVTCSSGYSFTSSHATNHFAISMFLIFTTGTRRRWLRWAIFLWALTIAYGQVYVGVHYPLDILGGSLLGTFIAAVGARLYYAFFPNSFQWT